MRKGLCECGCGGITSLATQTNRTYGHKKGQHVRYIVGHQSKDPKAKTGFGRRGSGNAAWKGGVSLMRDALLEEHKKMRDMPCKYEGCTNKPRGYKVGLCRRHYIIEYGRRPDVKEREKAKRQGEHHKKITRERISKYYRTPRGHLRATAANRINHEIKMGRMIRQPCEVCGEKAHAHHKSYLKKHWLDVDWLCPFHHKQWHMNNKAIYPSGI